MQYIGPKQVKGVRETGETTPTGISLIEVEYEDGLKEMLSKIMYDEIVSDKSCDLTELRDKRVRPVVAHTLALFREWGLKTGEVGYMSVLLNQSLESNETEAVKELWSKWTLPLNSLDDVSLIDIDRVLKSKKKEPIPSNFLDEPTK